MAECPLPKPNTRVRFPSPAPKRNPHATAWGFLFGIDDAFQNRVRATRARGEFAEQICATIAMQSWLGSDSRHSSFDKIFSIALHFSQTYGIMDISLIISMEKTMKKLTKTKKIILAVVAAVLCIAMVVGIVLWSSVHPLEKYALKLLQKQSFQAEILVTGIPFFGGFSLIYEIDGNIQHIPEGPSTLEAYVETVDDLQYTYKKDENGNWQKSEGAENAFADLENNETIKQLLNVDNYEPVEGEKNVYRQKADVTFEDFEDVTITIDGDKCMIEMVLLTNGMALEAMIIISRVGKIHLNLPTVQ